ncbi:T9SS type A sorting domain-containing protein, partial [bacterium]|nr:T9SS type A sorting domain-containing protein [bacterium]
QLSLSWDTATDSENSSSVKYALYRDTISGFTPNISTQIDTGLTSTTYLDTGLTNGITYYYRLLTYNCNSNSRYNTDEKYGKPRDPNACEPSDTTPPDWTVTTVANLVVTPGDAQNSLNWDNASDAENSNSIEYAVYRDIVSGFSPGPSTLIDTGLISSSKLDTGLANSTTYYYRILTYNCNGNSLYNTDEASGRPKSSGPCDTGDTTPPDWTVTGIANLTITNSTVSSITLSWSAATDSENTDSITYDVYRDISTVNTSTSSLIASDLSITNYTNINLLQGVNYHYRVLAKNCVPLSRLCSDELIGTISSNDDPVTPETNIKIYPNPFNLSEEEILYIVSNVAITDVNIYDISGKIAYEFNDIDKISDTQFTLNLKHTSAGLYLVIIKADKDYIKRLAIVK